MAKNSSSDLADVKKEIKNLENELRINDKLEVRIKESEKNLSYSAMFYTTLLVLFTATISVLEITELKKIILITIGIVFFFWLCFYQRLV